jgi:hypothetical protein
MHPRTRCDWIAPHPKKTMSAMKKALWLQLPRYQRPNVLDGANELNRYKRLRSISRRSPTRAGQEQLYRQRVREWLRRPENRWCRVYLLLRGERVRATQCHHYQGRRGMLLVYEPFWIPVSWEGHRWIDDHRERARSLGLLCPMGMYNSRPPHETGHGKEVGGPIVETTQSARAYE